MKKLGLIGKTLTYSFSQKYFTEKFEREQIDGYSYELFPIENIESLPALIEKENLFGFNVTIPYKEEIIPFLDEVSNDAREIGAVNTVVVKEGKLHGYNSDVFGFERSIKPFFKNHHERALILGTGGASKAAAFVLRKLGVEVLFVSRNPVGQFEVGYDMLNDFAIKNWPFLVNSTPVGTFPHIDHAPDLPYECFNDRNFVMDMVYNPEETQLMKNVRKQGAVAINGYNMLVLQAEKSFEIWQAASAVGE